MACPQGEALVGGQATRAAPNVGPQRGDIHRSATCVHGARLLARCHLRAVAPAIGVATRWQGDRQRRIALPPR
ncbi:hypothetical protein B296_00012658 [Ensete ventricosum]|uniref:Uncharacterized protein n=1 Tax=Ensete ventricosum TaxID=4639 RepID=A0A426ZI19_ENSVE|nr:hypothetical protein B296_00012658 [Ensete ventricosum]